jgi:hypothetical protein
VPFEEVDIQSQLYAIMEFRLPVAVLPSSLFSRCRLDVAGNVSALYLAQKIGHSEEIVVAETAAVDQPLAASDRSEGLLFSFFHF